MDLVSSILPIAQNAEPSAMNTDQSVLQQKNQAPKIILSQNVLVEVKLWKIKIIKLAG